MNSLNDEATFSKTPFWRNSFESPIIGQVVIHMFSLCFSLCFENETTKNSTKRWNGNPQYGKYYKRSQNLAKITKKFNKKLIEMKVTKKRLILIVHFFFLFTIYLTIVNIYEHLNILNMFFSFFILLAIFLITNTIWEYYIIET